jgi:hypothetical protein
MKIVLLVVASVLVAFICLMIWAYKCTGTGTLARQAYKKLLHTQLYNALMREEKLMTF